MKILIFCKKKLEIFYKQKKEGDLYSVENLFPIDIKDQIFKSILVNSSMLLPVTTVILLIVLAIATINLITFGLRRIFDVSGITEFMIDQKKEHFLQGTPGIQFRGRWWRECNRWRCRRLLVLAGSWLYHHQWHRESYYFPNNTHFHHPRLRKYDLYLQQYKTCW